MTTPPTSTIRLTPIVTPEATYHPWTDGYALGYEVRHEDGRVEYIYLNPSSDTDDGIPNVFVYIGPYGDPSMDNAAHFYDLDRER